MLWRNKIALSDIDQKLIKRSEEEKEKEPFIALSRNSGFCNTCEQLVNIGDVNYLNDIQMSTISGGQNINQFIQVSATFIG